ncbi:hypothetical protein ACS0TY_033469 [Phlomoides rotata]
MHISCLYSKIDLFMNLQTLILDFVFWALLLWQPAGVEFPPQEENNVPLFIPPPTHKEKIDSLKVLIRVDIQSCYDS